MGFRRRTRRRALVAGAAAAHHRNNEMNKPAGLRGGARRGAGGYAPPPADRLTQIEHLAQLHASGALTDEEFAAAKAQALGRSRTDGTGGCHE